MPHFRIFLWYPWGQPLLRVVMSPVLGFVQYISPTSKVTVNLECSRWCFTSATVQMSWSVGKWNGTRSTNFDIQGLQSPASRTGLFSPLELTVANSAPNHYSRYWAYSPCADHHRLFLVKSWFFCNKFVYILNTQVLSHFARQTRLLWILKLNHYLRQGTVFIWNNSQSIHSSFLQNCTARSQNKVIFKLYLARVQTVTTTHWSYLNCRCLNVLESNGTPHFTSDIIAWGLFTLGSWPPFFVWWEKQIWLG
jgi:hypothetical protein